MIYKVEIENDENMEELLEQCVAAKVPPVQFLTALVNQVLANARATNIQIMVANAEAPATLQ